MQPRPEFQMIMSDPNFPPVKSEPMSAYPGKDIIHCHWHPAIEIVYITKGMITMRIESSTFDLNEGGDICIVNPNQVHYAVSGNCESTLKYIVLSYDILNQMPTNPIYMKYLEPLTEGRLMLPSIISGPNQSEQPYPTWKKRVSRNHT